MRERRHTRQEKRAENPAPSSLMRDGGTSHPSHGEAPLRNRAYSFAESDPNGPNRYIRSAGSTSGSVHSRSIADPTPRQLEVLTFIAHFVRAEEWPPTVREIGAALGIESTNGVAEHLNALQRQNLIQRERSPRAIRLTRAGKQWTGGAR